LGTNAFESVGIRQIESLKLEVQSYRHKRTGARHFHLRTDDTNNAFLVAFLTMPQDSSGVAHILEHTALCGSQRFPVRDPFFGMLKRSLQTFMNAFTASDWTAYPFATQNRQDFDNLLQVYLDAAFFPKLTTLDFAQEGHRLEFEDPQDPDSALVFKGVVYNEMKGAMSPPSAQVHQALQSHLFPTITYHHNSGGDPQNIPELSHADLQAFHRRHYHPSNAVFMTYGNFPVEHHHERFEELALNQFDALDHGLAVPPEQRFTKPIAIDSEFTVDGEENPDESHVVLGWLLGSSGDLRYILRAQLLNSILLEHSGSPLRAALETSDLGAAPSELCGLDDGCREATFALGLEGTNPEHADAIEALIWAVLNQVAVDGVPGEEIESCLHQLELGQREVGGDHFPYGLNLMVRALSNTIHGGDPASTLDIDSELQQLREDSAAPGFVQELISTLLLNNPHRVRLTMHPSRRLTDTREQQLRDKLSALRATLDNDALVEIQAQADALVALQDRPDDSHLLPSVGIADIPEDIAIPVGRIEQVGNTPAHIYDASTNGLVYAQIVSDLPQLSAGLESRLALFCDLVTEVGASARDYRANQAWQVAVTGGVSATASLRSDPTDPATVLQFYTLRAKALARNTDALVALLTDTLARARFDEPARIRELVAQLRAHEEARLTDAGHVLALAAANDGLTPVGTIHERRNGLSAVAQLKALDDSLSDDAAVAELVSDLEQLRDALASAPRRLVIVSEAERQEQLRAAFERELSTLPRATTQRELGPMTMTGTPKDVAWVINSQVNFCARAFLAPAQTHADAPALTVLAHMLRTGFLHREIREKGGAYGGGASYDSNAGTFGFYSYRDPRLAGTLETFAQAPAWAHDAATDNALREASILGVIGSMDRPGSPAGEAISAFHSQLNRRDAAFFRAARRDILGVTADDLRRVIDTHLNPDIGRTAVVTNRRALEQEATGLDFEVKEL